jgi:hypothetical protein
MGMDSGVFERSGAVGAQYDEVKRLKGSQRPPSLRKKPLRYDLAVPIRPQKSVTMKPIRKRKKSNCATHVAVPAIPVNPNVPEMIPMIRKAIVKPNIFFHPFHWPV